MMRYRDKNRILRYTLALLVLISVNGCALLGHHSYTAPHVALPEQWQTPALGSDMPSHNSRFWENFQDPLLNRFIEQALEVNNDLLVASVKVQQARLEAGIARTDLCPTPTAAASGSLHKELDSGSSKTFSLSGALSYELDLWKKYSASYDVARLEASATTADYLSAKLSLIKTVADLYWQIGQLNQLVASNTESLDYAEQSLAIIQARYDAGDISAAELIQSQQSLLSSHTTLDQNRQSLSETRHAFSLLFNQEPQRQEAELENLDTTTLPQIYAGLPSELLRRRPDLLAAELRLQKAHTQAEVVRLSYLPSFSLTGTLGSSSNQLREVLRNPVATLGADLALPFLQWDLTQAKIAVAKNDYTQNAITFRQTLFTALAEVENALSAHNLTCAQQQRLKQSLGLAEHTQQLTHVRYRSGAVSLQEWLDSQQQVRIAAQDVSANRLLQLQNMMTLYLALGGDAQYTNNNPQAEQHPD